MYFLKIGEINKYFIDLKIIYMKVRVYVRKFIKIFIVEMILYLVLLNLYIL